MRSRNDASSPDVQRANAETLRGDIEATGTNGYGQDAQVSASGTLGKVKVGGSVRGTGGSGQASIYGNDGIGSIVIGGDFEGPGNQFGGLIRSIDGVINP